MQENQTAFRNMLVELKKLAVRKGNRLTQEEVRAFFKDTPLTDEHFQMIFAYLAGEKIRVEGYEAEEPEEETDPADPLSFYEEELKGIDVPDAKEKWKLFQLAAAGDGMAKAGLTRGYLSTVYDLAQTYGYGGAALGDLVQEGNVALLLALEELEVGLSVEDYEKFLYEKIRGAMEELLEEEISAHDIGPEEPPEKAEFSDMKFPLDTEEDGE